MPRYELCLILRCFERPEMVSAIKKATETILQRGGVLRSIENLGQRELPYRMFNHGQKHSHGNYVIAHFDSSIESMHTLRSTLSRDTNLIRSKLLRKEEEVSRPCEHGPCDFGEMDNEMRKRLHQQLSTYIQKL